MGAALPKCEPRAAEGLHPGLSHLEWPYVVVAMVVVVVASSWAEGKVWARVEDAHWAGPQPLGHNMSDKLVICFITATLRCHCSQLYAF